MAMMKRRSGSRNRISPVSLSETRSLRGHSCHNDCAARFPAAGSAPPVSHLSSAAEPADRNWILPMFAGASSILTELGDQSGFSLVTDCVSHWVADLSRGVLRSGNQPSGNQPIVQSAGGQSADRAISRCAERNRRCHHHDG